MTSGKEEFECRMFPDELREAQRRAFPPDAFRLDSPRRKFINEAAIRTLPSALKDSFADRRPYKEAAEHAYLYAVALWEHVEREETKHELKEHAKQRAAHHAAEAFYSKERLGGLPETGL